MNKFLLFLIVGVFLQGRTAQSPGDSSVEYYDNSGRTDVLSGGVTMIPIETGSATHRVWTKRVGNNPTIKVLLLHGGPGMSHEFFEVFDSFFPGAGIEYYYYDQLGSAYSDKPDDPELWTLPRFVDEVEQVRKALGLDASNFYLYGHSWGGILATEYAVTHQENLKGLIISNMMASVPAYNKYVRDVLMQKLPPEVLAEMLSLEEADDIGNPRYRELIGKHYNPKHLLRMSENETPEPVTRSVSRINFAAYSALQGPSDIEIYGSLVNWDRSAELSELQVPTLVIGAEYDIMDPKYMEWMANTLPNGRYLYCPMGSHSPMYDDMNIFFEGLIKFIHDVDIGRP